MGLECLHPLKLAARSFLYALGSSTVRFHLWHIDLRLPRTNQSRARFRYLMFNGATIIDINRPSILGLVSSFPKSSKSPATRISTSRPISG